MYTPRSAITTWLTIPTDIAAAAAAADDDDDDCSDEVIAINCEVRTSVIVLLTGQCRTARPMFLSAKCSLLRAYG